MVNINSIRTSFAGGELAKLAQGNVGSELYRASYDRGYNFVANEQGCLQFRTGFEEVDVIMKGWGSLAKTFPMRRGNHVYRLQARSVTYTPPSPYPGQSYMFLTLNTGRGSVLKVEIEAIDGDLFKLKPETTLPYTMDFTMRTVFTNPLRTAVLVGVGGGWYEAYSGNGTRIAGTELSVGQTAETQIAHVLDVTTEPMNPYAYEAVLETTQAISLEGVTYLLPIRPGVQGKRALKFTLDGGSVDDLTVTYPDFPDEAFVAGCIIQDRLMLVTDTALVYMSRSPDPETGDARHEDFTLVSTFTNDTGADITVTKNVGQEQVSVTLGDTETEDVILATDAIKFRMSPGSGITKVHWVVAYKNNRVLVGTNVGVFVVSSSGPAFSPWDIQVDIFSTYPASPVFPVIFGTSLIWESGGRLVRSVFDFRYEQEVARGETLLVDLPTAGLRGIYGFTGGRDMLVLVYDQELVLAVQSRENAFSFFRIAPGAAGAVNMGRASAYQDGDFLEVYYVNGGAYRFRPQALFYAAPSTSLPVSVADSRAEGYHQIAAAPLLLDRGQRFTFLAGISLLKKINGEYRVPTAAGAVGTRLLFSEVGAVFEITEEIGEEKKCVPLTEWYDLEEDPDRREGDGFIYREFRNVLRSFTTQSLVVRADWRDKLVAIGDGEEDPGATIEAVNDLAIWVKVTHSRPVFVSQIGIPYQGWVKTLPLVEGGVAGVGINNPRGLMKAFVDVVNTGQLKMKVDGKRDFTTVVFNEEQTNYDIRPLFTGTKEIKLPGGWAPERSFVIYQDKPQPVNIRYMNFYESVTNE